MRPNVDTRAQPKHAKDLCSYTDVPDTRGARLSRQATFQRAAVARERERIEEADNNWFKKEKEQNEKEQIAAIKEKELHLKLEKVRRRHAALGISAPSCRRVKCPMDLQRVVESKDIAWRTDRSLILVDVRRRIRRQELQAEKARETRRA
jgi:hypothetical protein